MSGFGLFVYMIIVYVQQLCWEHVKVQLFPKKSFFSSEPIPDAVSCFSPSPEARLTPLPVTVRAAPCPCPYAPPRPVPLQPTHRRTAWQASGGTCWRPSLRVSLNRHPNKERKNTHERNAEPFKEFLLLLLRSSGVPRNLRNDLLVAADSITNTMSSLVKELHSGWSSLSRPLLSDFLTWKWKSLPEISGFLFPKSTTGEMKKRPTWGTVETEVGSQVLFLCRCREILGLFCVNNKIKTSDHSWS